MSEGKKPLIFISYRWSHAFVEARDLEHSIQQAFEHVRVFRDESYARAGNSISGTIKKALDETALALALLHENWQTEPPKAKGSLCNKLFLQDDWVTMELMYARSLGIRIIPVLYYGATLPPRNDQEELDRALPKSLQFLSDDTIARAISKSDYSATLEGLLQFLEAELQLERRKENQKETGRSCLEEEGLILSARYWEDLKKKVEKEKEDAEGPYRGLPYYEERHAPLFFGRSAEICSLWNMLERRGDQRLLLLHGYSGVGKSSLLNAGLIPRIRGKNWTVKIKRRDKKETLASLFEKMMVGISPEEKTLLIIDQVEEALIEPVGNGNDEFSAFFSKIRSFLDQFPDVKVMLGFRKEFLPEIEEAVDKAGLKRNTGGFLLKPLSRRGMEEAVHLDASVRDYFRLDVSAIAEKIIHVVDEKDYTPHAQELSNKGPWLQLILFNLWGEASKKAGKYAPRIFSEDLLHQVAKDSFGKMIDGQLAQLAHNDGIHRDLLEKGLTLDLLYFLTTSRGTADTRTDEEILDRYPMQKDHIIDHIRKLENLQLVRRSEDNFHHKETRLAHDALAPVVRDRFDLSDAPAQRAHRIFEGKKVYDVTGVFLSPIQDQEDIEILREARAYMRNWQNTEERAYEEGRELVEKNKAELRDKTAFIFESFAEKGGSGRIRSLDYDDALSNLEVAIVETRINKAEKKAKLWPSLEELFYFYSLCAVKDEQARKAAGLLLQLEPPEQLGAGLRKFQAAGWSNSTERAALLKELPDFQKYHARYYPEMIEVEGGVFTMGSKVEPDETPHKVRLKNFKIATTPLTFYQHALFYMSTGKSIVANTPSWGRQGDHPVVYFTWYDAIEYLNWFSGHLGREACYSVSEEKDPNNKVAQDYLKHTVKWMEKPGFRLPTEAEWEYAARGGRKKQDFPFAGSKDLDEVGWFWENSGDQPLNGKYDFKKVQDNNCRTHPVKEKRDNGIGLYDMNGNVWEWCWDWYQAEYYKACKELGTAENPKGPEGSDSGRVLRGGSWLSSETNCRVAYRNRLKPILRDYSVGFRPAQDY